MRPVGGISAIVTATLFALAAGVASSQPGSRADLDRGATLAKIGDCAVCHTAAGGAPFAGGRPISTPFGTVFASNITPDGLTGIGKYSVTDFKRAMTEGVRRDGAQLYPAFPYDHFAGATSADLDALYAFLMTRRPVPSVAPPPRLIPLLGFRPLMLGWKALYFRPQAFRSVAGKSDQWNRGAYLVATLGHCGACHTPHGWLGAESKSKTFDGGYADGWYAPALNSRSPATTPWTEERLFTYLRTGLDANHAAAAGPMGPVTRELARATPADVRAMAAYLADLMHSSQSPGPIDRAKVATQEYPQGAQLYEGACAGCHEPGAPMMGEGRPPLSVGTPLNEDDPRDTIAIVLNGLEPPVDRTGPFMPAFSWQFSDTQVVDIAGYLRARFSARSAWPGLPAAVRAARKETAG